MCCKPGKARPMVEKFLAIAEMEQEFHDAMKGYHDLVDHGRREIYTIEA